MFSPLSHDCPHPIMSNNYPMISKTPIFYSIHFCPIALPLINCFSSLSHGFPISHPIIPLYLSHSFCIIVLSRFPIAFPQLPCVLPYFSIVFPQFSGWFHTWQAASRGSRLRRPLLREGCQGLGLLCSLLGGFLRNGI